MLAAVRAIPSTQPAPGGGAQQGHCISTVPPVAREPAPTASEQGEHAGAQCHRNHDREKGEHQPFIATVPMSWGANGQASFSAARTCALARE